MSETRISIDNEDIDIFSIPKTPDSVSIDQQVEDAADIIDGEDIFGDDDAEEQGEDFDTDDSDDSDSYDESDSDSFEVNETNLVPLLGAQLLKEGILPEGFEISSKTSHKDIYEAYKESVHEEVENDIFNRIQNKLTEEGVTEENIFHAKLISTGTSVDVLKSIVTDKSLSEQKFDGVDSKENVSLVKKFLEETNQGSKKITQKLLETALLDDDDFKELFDEGKEYFEKTAKAKENVELERHEQVKANREIIIRKNQQVVQQVLSKGEVLGIKIPNIRKFTESISDNSEIIEIRGEQRRVTKLGKFLMEFNNNPELQIAAFVQYSSGSEIIERAKNEGEQTGETNLLKNFSMVQDKGISKKQVTDLTNKKATTSKRNNSYFFQTTR